VALELNVELHPKQGEALKLLAKTEILGYGGARGGGKSHLARIYLIARSLKYPKSKHLLVRKTFPELQRNHIDRFISDYVNIGVCKYIERRHQLVFPNGSIIELGYCEGEKDLIKFQGGEYDTIILDEAQFHRKKIFQDLRACLRTTSEIKPRMLMTFNPGGVGHMWLKRMFIDKQMEVGEDPQHFAFLKALVYDNPSLMENDPEYIRRLEALPEPMRSAMLHGDFTVFEGQFYNISPLSLVKPFHIEESECMERLYGSLDHGTTHSTSFGLWYSAPNGNMYRLFSYLNDGGTAETHADEIYQRLASFTGSYGQMPVKIFADPSMWTKSKVNEQFSRAIIDEYIDRFQKGGARTIFQKANNDKKNGCSLLRQVMNEVDGMPTMFYWDGYNSTFLEGMQTVITDPNNRDITLKMDGDDTADECRYGVLGVYSEQALERKKVHINTQVNTILAQRESVDWYNL